MENMVYFGSQKLRTMKISKAFTLLTTILLSASVMAQQRSEEEMEQIAMKALGIKASAQTKGVLNGLNIQLTTPELGIYSRSGGGWVIVSGDERTLGAILAYSTDGTMDWENAPDHVVSWIEGYREQIRSLGDIQLPAGNLEPGTTPVVSPLITTKWNQKAPYFNYCPSRESRIKYGNDSIDCINHCVAGCVSISMAQIMKYYNYPEYGQGHHTDAYEYSESADFTHLYDWENMNDEYKTVSQSIEYDSTGNAHMVYNGDWTDAQANAVAQLIHDCGVAANMEYGTDVSNAFAVTELYAMQSFFGYSTNASLELLINYNDIDEWNEMLKNELNASRPVMYFGMDPDEGGHAFICDGYDDQGYFHFNFGWGGTDDGYYLTSAIGIEGKYLFTEDNEAIIGLQPAGQTDRAIYSNGQYFVRNSNELELELIAYDDVDQDGHLDIPDQVNVQGQDYTVTSIVVAAFIDNRCIHSVSVGNNISIIDDEVFRGCTSLDSIKLGTSITKLYDYAFYSDTLLKSITCMATEPPYCYSEAFNCVDVSKITLYVPQQSLQSYKTADTWKDFGKITGITPTGIIKPDSERHAKGYFLNRHIMIHDGRKYLVE